MNIYDSADPTKYSIIKIDDSALIYKRSESCRYEAFSSLISTGIFNVCQYYSPNNKDIYSIPIDPILVEEKCNMSEIIADLAFIDLIFGTGGDVTIIPTDEYRDKHGDITVGSNCRVFPNGVYSRFDVDCISFYRYSDIQILDKILESIISIYNIPYLDGWNSAADMLDFPKNSFGNRILTKATQLLELYKGVLGKEFFIKQYIRAKSVCGEDTHITDDERGKLSIDYNNFIDTLQRISRIFTHDKDIILKHIGSKRMQHKQIIFHLKSAFYILIGKRHKVPSDIMHMR